MRMVAPRYFTADMVRAIPDDGKRYETVYGELLVSPSPRPLHQRVLARLQLAVGVYLQTHPAGLMLASPADISWAPDVLVQPDLFVVDRDQARALDWSRMQRLLLAVEILSPSSVRADRFVKRAAYQRYGVETYWLVDADEQLVEVWTPGAVFPVAIDAELRWHPAGASADFVLRLNELFAPV